jgi:ATP-dependent DNA helicase RecG
VAVLAALVTSRSGYQSAFMAPTEVLSRQHFHTLEKLFAYLGGEERSLPSVGLLTASGARALYEGNLTAALTKPKAKEQLRAGEIKILIGTHALIQKSVKFRKLGLVVVDEQHRFGVKQRQALLGDGAAVPHFLSMSATPIPRTLMLTVFGDLDVSLIDELPSGRKKVITKVVPPEKREAAYGFIRKQVKEGRQVFVICPRIEIANIHESDSRIFSSKQIREIRGKSVQIREEIKSVKEEHEKLSKKIFPDLRVAMLHGKLTSKEKEKIMKDFREGKSDILVATSVVEVGVDVPNATIMMIEGSERFGLAQLYQFRGRVGRGEHQSYCLLFTDSSAKTTQQRLKALLTAKNGFELAEYDLKIRGPGEFLGEEQTGFPDLTMRALQDPALVKSSREAALAIARRDQELKAYPLLRERLAEFKREIHLE